MNSNNTASSSTLSSMSSSQIVLSATKKQLPLLYFENRGSILRINATGNKSAIHKNDEYLDLPVEVVRQFLTSYATWGDLAKLSLVQKQWKNILTDSANESAEAKWSLSQAYLNGSDGIPVRPVKAIQYLLELASFTMADNQQQQQNQQLHNTTKLNSYTIPAMKKLAQLYLEGCTCAASCEDSQDESIEQDTETGLSWLMRCYDAGDSSAAHDLALVYEYGHYNVPIDVVAAFEWFSKAANAGHIEAMAELGLCYELGCGVEQSDQLALDWYMRAAELGHNTAKYSIGEAFEEARGVPQSDEEACLWYYKAAIEGCEDSRKALRRLEDIARIVIPGARALLEA